MQANVLFVFVIAYFLLLLFVAWYTSRNANNESFFIGNRNSNWMLVSFGMIGTSLSGVTFVSVPGTVGSQAFSYFQVVIGYFIGYFIVAFVLLPLYYKMQLTSIYNYLLNRFGNTAYKTGAFFFIISRVLGATARLYLVINVLQLFILDDMNIPFWLTSLVILVMILLYTFEGGVKTIVFTDTLQTTFMIAGLLICIGYVMHAMDFSLTDSINALSVKGLNQIWNTDTKSSGFFLKQVIGGAFITIGMTGLDQEMMQKNISVRRLWDSQKNMMTFSIIMVLVNLLFLFLGGILYVYANVQGITAVGDDLFPTVALHYMPTMVSVVFIIALISALFPSADGALTALTSSFCIDILGIQRDKNLDEKKKKHTRMNVHFTFALIFFLCILAFKWIDDKSIIGIILTVAGYTYGPLLGLFGFGIFSKRRLDENALITIICLVAPVICYFLSIEAKKWLGGYQIGIELLLINGIITYFGLWAISKKPK